MVTTEPGFKIAIVHPWFLAHGGAEHTVNVLAAMFPAADFFTLLFNEKDLPPNIRGRNLKASMANLLPWKYQIYRYLFPFYPRAFEALDLRGYNLVISSDSCLAKGVLIDQNARHVCYCHSPMRSIWDQRYEFRDILPSFARPVFSWFTHSVRQWDFQAAQRVDYFVANSRYVAERIERYYRRGSRVIYPPVNTNTEEVLSSHQGYYLSVGRLTETKRIDLLIQACNRLNRQLVVIGSGRHTAALKNLAGPSITFIGTASDGELHKFYRNCRALLFAANEDFGIVPVEAQSHGRPVIAFGQGGSLETVVGFKEETRQTDPTGIFFAHQTVESLSDAILQFEAIEDIFDPIAIQQHAARFSRARFENDFQELIRIVTSEMSNPWEENKEVLY